MANNNNTNDALLHRLQQMSLNNGSYERYSPSSSINQVNYTNNPHTGNYALQQQQYVYMSDDTASGIYENVEYTSVIAANPSQITDLDAIDIQNFKSSNAKAQPQLKASNGNNNRNFKPEHENLRYAHTPQPSDMVEPSPIYENLQIISGVFNCLHFY